jgi:hypothetical protein
MTRIAASLLMVGALAFAGPAHGEPRDKDKTVKVDRKEAAAKRKAAVDKRRRERREKRRQARRSGAGAPGVDRLPAAMGAPIERPRPPEVPQPPPTQRPARPLGAVPHPIVPQPTTVTAIWTAPLVPRAAEPVQIPHQSCPVPEPPMACAASFADIEPRPSLNWFGFFIGLLSGIAVTAGLVGTMRSARTWP